MKAPDDVPTGFAVEYRAFDPPQWVVFQGCGCGHSIAACVDREGAVAVARLAAERDRAWAALEPFAVEAGSHRRLEDVDDITGLSFEVCEDCDESWPCRFERARTAHDGGGGPA